MLTNDQYGEMKFNIVNDKNMRAIYLALTGNSICNADTLDKIHIRRIWFQRYQYTEDNQNYSWANVSLRWAEDFETWLRAVHHWDNKIPELTPEQIKNLMTIVRMPRAFFSDRHIKYLKDIPIEDYRLGDWRDYIDAIENEKILQESKLEDIFHTKDGQIGIRLDRSQFIIGTKLFKIKLETKDKKSIVIDNQ